MEQRLQGIQRSMDWRETESMVRLETSLREEYEHILLQEELLWYQKSRERWVRFGDRNTRFFHTQTVIRRKRNKIHGMFVENGVWCTEPEELAEAAQRFFTNLFSLDVQVVRNNIMDNTTPKISSENQVELVQPISLEEVRRAVMAMDAYKAPGADGFQAFFYKQYWHIIGRDLHKMVSDAFFQGRGEEQLLDTLIVLIPKVDNPQHFKDLRPISLRNVAYKIITKVLVNRFRPLVTELIGHLQGSFIPG